MTGASYEDIHLAEQALGLQFAADYRQYIAEFGAASFDGHELTGICTSTRLNVVKVTQNERKNNVFALLDWYVIEQTGIDSITIWQNSKGEVFLTIPYGRPQKICNSLAEYINL